MKTYHIQATLEVSVDEKAFTNDETGAQLSNSEVLDQIKADCLDDFEEFCGNYSPTTTGDITVTQQP